MSIIPRSIFDDQFAELVNKSSVTVILRVLSAVLSFVMAVLLARSLGVAGSGIYFLCLSLVTALVVLCKLGTDTAMLQLVSVWADRNLWGAINTKLRMVVSLVAFVSVLVTCLIFVLADQISASILQKPELSETLRIVSPAIVFLAVAAILSESLRGVGRIAGALIVSNLVIPISVILSLLPKYLGNALPYSPAYGYLLGSLGSMILGLLFWRSKVAVSRDSGQAASHPDFQKDCLNLWLLSLVTWGLIPHAPMLIMGVFSSSEELGVYGAVQRVSMVLSFFLSATNFALAPILGRLYSRGEIKKIRVLNKKAALMVTTLGFPVFVIMIIKGSWVLGFFGDAFETGSGALALVTLGYLVSSAIGPAGLTLVVTGNADALRKSALIAGGTVLLVSLFLIPREGALGAAAATASAITVMNVLNFFFARSRLELSSHFRCEASNEEK